jgi:hypothetical protein
MKNCMLIILLAGFSCRPDSTAEKSSASDVAAIRQVMARQEAAWNNADIDKFMEGYWKSDSLLFIGSKITHAWASTLTRYKASYPGKKAMGTLRFDLMRIDFISHGSYLVTGKYFLTREKDNPSGIFTLLFKLKNGEWVIVYDHTA